MVFSNFFRKPFYFPKIPDVLLQIPHYPSNFPLLHCLNCVQKIPLPLPHPIIFDRLYEKKISIATKLKYIYSRTYIYFCCCCYYIHLVRGFFIPHPDMISPTHHCITSILTGQKQRKTEKVFNQKLYLFPIQG